MTKSSCSARLSWGPRHPHRWLLLGVALALAASLGGCATAGDGSGGGDVTPDARLKDPSPGPDAGDLGPSPYGVDLYLRGTFNDYDLSSLMRYEGQNRYTAELSLSAGSHEFKIADAAYGDDTTFAVAATGADAIELDMPTTLQPAVGIDNNALLFVPQTGTYRFELSAVNRTNPVLLVSQGTPAPYATTLYLRGSFNDFDTSLPLSYIGQGRYSARLALVTGSHELKIADASYSDGTTFSVSATATEAIEIGTPALLVAAIGADNNTSLDVDQTGLFEFTLDANAPATPTLLVTRVEVAPYENRLFLRGDFNGFDTSIEMAFVGQGRYVGSVLLNQETYAFKVADEGFTSQQTFSVDPAQGPTIEVGQAAPMATTTSDGANTEISITAPAVYAFALDASDVTAPTLTADIGEAAPYPRSMFLQGTFNGFTAVDRMDYIGDDRYELVIALAAGSYEFKIADEDFTDATTFSVDANTPTPVQLTIPAKLEPASGEGNNTLFTVATGADFRFSLDAQDPQAPILLVTVDAPALTQ